MSTLYQLTFNTVSTDSCLHQFINSGNQSKIPKLLLAQWLKLSEISDTLYLLNEVTQSGNTEIFQRLHSEWNIPVYIRQERVCCGHHDYSFMFFQKSVLREEWHHQLTLVSGPWMVRGQTQTHFKLETFTVTSSWLTDRRAGLMPILTGDWSDGQGLEVLRDRAGRPSRAHL